MERQNTEKSTANAIRIFNRHIDTLPLIDGKKVTSIEDVYSFDHYQINLVMESFCENVRMQNKKRYKNDSLMTEKDGF